jgi:hypothetical protein
MLPKTCRQVEQSRGLVGILEDKGGGLVDRGRPRPGGGVGLGTGMNGKGVKTIVGHVGLLVGSNVRGRAYE